MFLKIVENLAGIELAEKSGADARGRPQTGILNGPNGMEMGCWHTGLLESKREII